MHGTATSKAAGMRVMDELLTYLAAGGDAFTIGLVIYLVRLDRRILALEIYCRQALKDNQ